MGQNGFPRTRVALAVLALTIVLFISGCGDDGVLGPGDCGTPPPPEVDHRDAMRSFVGNISAHARATTPSFIVIAQGGLPLLTTGGQPDDPFDAEYLAALSGIGQEGLYYDLAGGDVPTDPVQRQVMISFLDRITEAGKPVLATSFCQDHDNMDNVYTSSTARGYLAFAAPSRSLDLIPDYPVSPHRTHDGHVTHLGDACNYLLLTDPGSHADREGYLAQLGATDHDVLILDADHGGAILTPAEVDSLRTKQNGGQRLVLASLAIDRAGTHRDYWQAGWDEDPPSWLTDPLENDPGSTLVQYWSPEWQAIIFGGPEAALDRIVAAGFDGVYLEGLEAYEEFEDADG